MTPIQAQAEAASRGLTLVTEGPYWLLETIDRSASAAFADEDLAGMTRAEFASACRGVLDVARVDEEERMLSSLLTTVTAVGTLPPDDPSAGESGLGRFFDGLFGELA